MIKFHNVENEKPPIGEAVLVRMKPVEWENVFVRYYVFKVVSEDLLVEFGGEQWWTLSMNMVESWITLEELDGQITF